MVCGVTICMAHTSMIIFRPTTYIHASVHAFFNGCSFVNMLYTSNYTHQTRLHMDTAQYEWLYCVLYIHKSENS